MKTYTVARTCGAPNWAAVPALQVDEHPWTDTFGIRMTHQMCYDENGIYIHQRAWEENIRAEGTHPLSSVLWPLKKSILSLRTKKGGWRASE